MAEARVHLLEHGESIVCRYNLKPSAVEWASDPLRVTCLSCLERYLKDVGLWSKHTSRDLDDLHRLCREADSKPTRTPAGLTVT